MSDSVSVVVRVVARSETVAEIGAIVQRLAARSRQEDGCISYDVLQDVSRPELFLLVEEWTSVSALDAHNKTAHFFEAVGKSQPLLAEPFVVSRFKTVG